MSSISRLRIIRQLLQTNGAFFLCFSFRAAILCTSYNNVNTSVLLSRYTSPPKDYHLTDFTCSSTISKQIINMNNENMCGQSDSDLVVLKETFPEKAEDSKLKFPAMDESGVQDASSMSCSDDSGKSDEKDFIDAITLTSDEGSGNESTKKAKLSAEKSHDKPKECKGDKLVGKKSKKLMNSSNKSAMRPNHFVAVKVGNPEILEKLKAVQQSVLEKEPRLKSVIVDVATSHLTLLVMRLANDEEIEKATDLLRNSFVSFQEKFSDQIPTLEISGLGHFNNQVLFAKAKQGKDLDLLTELAQDVRARFEGAGIDLSGGKDFKPHLTISKMSKDPKLYQKGIKKISKQTYEEHIEDHFGSQAITELQLCSMNKPKDESGYYHVCSQFNFES